MAAPFVLTYATLTSLVQQTFQRSDAEFVAFIPVAILCAQRDIQKKLKVLLIETTVTGVFTINSPTLAKPADWVSTISFWTGAGTTADPYIQMQQRSMDYCLGYYNTPNQTGIDVPTLYSDKNYTNFFVSPTPVAASTYLLIYQATQGLLGDAGGGVPTNNITATLPELLIYRTYMECNYFVKTDPRMPTWERLYSDALQAALAEEAYRFGDRFDQRDKT